MGLPVLRDNQPHGQAGLYGPRRAASHRRARRRPLRRPLLLQGLAVVLAVAAGCSYFLVSGRTTPGSLASRSRAARVQPVAPELVTRARASVPATARHAARGAHRGTARAAASPSPSVAAPGVAVGPSASAVPPANGSSRSPYNWPFAWNSIWNMPIATTATYGAASIVSNGTYQDAASQDYDSVNPSAPVVTLTNARLASGAIGPVSVHSDPAMTANGQWNTCSAFLGADNMTVYQGQTTELTAGGNPSFGGVADNTWAPVNIEGLGTAGCHGGSGLSGLGGTLTLADLTQSGPITHALKVALDGQLNYSSANGGFRWPALNSDAGFTDSGSVNFYGGSNPNVQQGSLLALPRSISPSSFSNPLVDKLAQAAQDYGVYIVDTTATGPYGYSSMITNYNATATFQSDLCATSCTHPSSNQSVIGSQLDTLLKDLQVITNNTPSTPGGGSIGTSRCAPYAPPFDSGAGAPPAVTVAAC